MKNHIKFIATPGGKVENKNYEQKSGNVES